MHTLCDPEVALLAIYVKYVIIYMLEYNKQVIMIIITYWTFIIDQALF